MSIYIRKFWLMLSIGFCIVFAGFVMQTANSHSNATGMVKERMDFMKDLGKASKSIGKMIKNEIRFDREQLIAHARLINEHSKTLLDYFPEGSLQHPTEALPVIWENWGDFQKRNETLQIDSQKLLEIAQEGDKSAIAKQFAAVGRSCKGCHQDYRQKKK